jgi:hypothetical protein
MPPCNQTPPEAPSAGRDDGVGSQYAASVKNISGTLEEQRSQRFCLPTLTKPRMEMPPNKTVIVAILGLVVAGCSVGLIEAAAATQHRHDRRHERLALARARLAADMLADLGERIRWAQRRLVEIDLARSAAQTQLSRDSAQ